MELKFFEWAVVGTVGRPFYNCKIACFVSGSFKLDLAVRYLRFGVPVYIFVGIPFLCSF